MRINKYLAQSTGMSRRTADRAIAEGCVLINGSAPQNGQQVGPEDVVLLNNNAVVQESERVTIMLNKPAGFVCSRTGQGSRTIYDLLPERYHTLKSIGRLDKETSGLLLLTDDGELAQRLTHPSFRKVKIYEVSLDRPLEPLHHQMINDRGIQLKDGASKLLLSKVHDDASHWRVTMHEGRNRQIRRTFESLGYRITALHRTQFGDYVLGGLAPAQIREM